MSEHLQAGADPAQPLLQLIDVGKTYVNNRAETRVLENISFEIRRGEVLAIVGPSGAGKSTLLHILGTLDRPSCGRVLYLGDDLFSRDPGSRAAFRNHKLGFIFQFHHLLPEFTALENTMMPALIAGGSTEEAARKAEALLCRIGLGHRLTHKQGELSGGEQQRVAVARALIMEPEIVLADEPTGNLDSQTGESVFSLLLDLNREMSMTLIVVTHNEAFAHRMNRHIKLVDGCIV